METKPQNETKVNELYFDKIELIRGETPPDIIERCLKMCQEYLNGNWNQQTLDTIEVRRISGGLTNQTYYCGIIDKCGEEVPQEVAIRLYGPKYFDTCGNGSNERLSDTVISLMVSENKLGPKLYGIFEQGQIQKFYKHRQFRTEEQKDPKLVEQVFKKLAMIHSMDVPTKKNTNWVFNFLKNSIEISWQKFDLAKEIDEYKCETLKNNDLRKEVEFMESVVKSNNCVIVFSHSDYRCSNLMVTEPNDEISVCDFESSGYSYRGQDLANQMREWGRNPMDFVSIEELPPKDSVFRPLIEIYFEESKRINGESYSQNEFNSVEQILKETKLFLLIGSLFGLTFSLSNDEKSGFPMNRKMSMEFAENNFKNYFKLKQILKQQNLISF